MVRLPLSMLGDKARQMYTCGETDVGVISCGQGIGLVHDIPTVAELFDRIMAEAEAARNGIRITNGLFRF